MNGAPPSRHRPACIDTRPSLLVIRDAAQEPGRRRIFVNAAIKKALCREAKGDRSWLSKVRPFWGHDYHFHIRITAPRQQAMRAAAGAEGRRRLRAFRSRLLVQGRRYCIRSRHRSRPSRVPDNTGEAAARVQGGSGSTRCKAITVQAVDHVRKHASIAPAAAPKRQCGFPRASVLLISSLSSRYAASNALFSSPPDAFFPRAPSYRPQFSLDWPSRPAMS